MSQTATARPGRTRAGSTVYRRRPARRPRRRLGAILITALALALGVTGGWLIGFSSVFAARLVTVAGNRELTGSAVQDAAQVPLGEPLARLDLGAIARRTTQLPQVAEVRVRRDWPDTVALTVVERVPLLAVARPPGYLMVDSRGVAYESRPAVPAGVVQVAVDPGDVTLLTDVGVVAAALPVELKKKVRRISATTRDNLTLTLASGLTVVWGSAAESPLKAGATLALLERKPGRRIDVSSPHTPVIR